MIPYGSSVTLWCQGNLKAQVYRLYADDSPWYLDTQKSLEPGDRAKFLITGKYAEKYTCNYLSPMGWSGHSDPLELVVTGERTLRGPSFRLCPQEGGLLSGCLPLTAQP